MLMAKMGDLLPFMPMTSDQYAMLQKDNVAAAALPGLAALGITLPTKNTHRLAYPCMDWSERKDHLAGTLARALLASYLQKDWLRPDGKSRALTITPLGERELLPLLAISR